MANVGLMGPDPSIVMTVLRSRLFTNLDPVQWPTSGVSPLNKAILAIVSLSILAAVLESESSLRNTYPFIFEPLNVLFAVLFLVEYLLRLWAMGEDPRYGGFLGRIRYACTIASIIDLVATVVLWVDIILGIQGTYGVELRLVRALRIITLARNSEWADAILLLGTAIRTRRRELILSFGLTLLILLVSATCLFVVEGTTQPEAFGSIPRAMWWAMATLTTVGYGDVYPITAIGKLCAGISAITSIAIVAMPTGIMAAAFSDVFQLLRKDTD